MRLMEELSKRTEILAEDPLFELIHQVKAQNEILIQELNHGLKTSEEVKDLISQMTGQTLDKTVSISLPFQTDFGSHISIGKEVFINKEVFLADLGGITIEDKVLIGPRVNLITVNHIIDPTKRRGLQISPILIKKNAWLGAGATVLPGVIIGENAIVAANSTVTKNVPDNTIVAGSPARVIKIIA
ncbi:DapH/DapD/GlmU-related protein [Streptococcus sp. zg-JUN1979]|uniref:DapH/DapD/GlmU-related protein n=1 Tax=Streptococcus sp. zg-JUN1979 TaxID=3391450 RepID=UPI0039A47E25